MSLYNEWIVWEQDPGHITFRYVRLLSHYSRNPLRCAERRYASLNCSIVNALARRCGINVLLYHCYILINKYFTIKVINVNNYSAIHRERQNYTVHTVTHQMKKKQNFGLTRLCSYSNWNNAPYNIIYTRNLLTFFYIHLVPC